MIGDLRNILPTLQAALYAAIKTQSPNRKVFTTAPPATEEPPMILFWDLQAQRGEIADAKDAPCVVATVTLEIWDRSGENTGALAMVGECMAACQADPDLSADGWSLLDRRVEDFRVRSEVIDQFGVFQHGTVRATFIAVDTRAGS
jgi:hypothetical protein